MLLTDCRASSGLTFATVELVYICRLILLNIDATKENNKNAIKNQQTAFNYLLSSFEET